MSNKIQIEKELLLNVQILLFKLIDTEQTDEVNELVDILLNQIQNKIDAMERRKAYSAKLKNDSEVLSCLE